MMPALRRLRPALLAGALLAAACAGDEGGTDGDAGAARPEISTTSILLVTLDTARADAFGCYGGRARTPVTDALAAEGVLFRNAFTPVPVTQPAHTSLFTGLTPARHGIRDNGLFTLEGEATTLAEHLAEAGWHSAAFVSSIVLDERYGLAQGFAHYDDDVHESEWARRTVERPAVDTVDRAVRYLAEHLDEERLFLWVHLFDPHSPFNPPRAFAAEYADFPYHGEVAYADQEMGRIIDAFRQARADAVVVVTADHGDALGGREPSHGLLLYGDTMNVPLVMAGPGLPAGLQVTEPVGLVDLFPTLLACAGRKPPAGLDGTSLLARLDGTARPEPVLLETMVPYYDFGWSGLMGVVAGRYKLVRGSTSTELYDLENDPHETANVAAFKPDVVARLSRKIDEAMARPARYEADSVALDAAGLAALESLGYTASSAGTLPASDVLVGRDPTEMIAGMRAHMAADQLTARGRFAEARAQLEALLAADPDNHFLHHSYGRVLARTGEFEKGRAELAIALAARPDKPGASFYMGMCLEGLGENAEAEQAYRTTIAIAPRHGEARFRLAGLLWERDAKEEARKLYREFLALEIPRRPPQERTARARVGE